LGVARREPVLDVLTERSLPLKLLRALVLKPLAPVFWPWVE